MSRQFPETQPAAGLFDRTFRALFWILLAFMALRLFRDGQIINKVFYYGDLDDMLRLAMLRDWLAGQDWFDYTQHRMLAEGVSLHWSRYIDAGLAAILVPFSWILPQSTAEAVTLTLWPGLLYALFMAQNGLGTRRILGAAGGIAAMVFALSWAKFAYVDFTAGRIDHHNVQLLGASVMLFAFGVPEASTRAAIRSGIFGATGFAISLSAGLEMLPPMLLIWFTAGLRLAFGARSMRPWLAGFAIAAGILAPLLFLGQTASAEWPIPYCDELAPPVLLVVGSGVVASLLGVWLSAKNLGAMPVILGMAGALIACIAVSWPVVSPCLAGPYGDMTPEARALIPVRIFDTQPAFGFFLEKGENFDVLMLPLLAVTLGAATFGAAHWRQITVAQRWMLALCLGIALLGLLGSLKQFRAMAMGSAAMPFLGGFIAARMVAMWQSGRSLATLLTGLAVAVPAIFPIYAMQLPRHLLLPPPSQKALIAARNQAPCLQRGALRGLDQYPPALIASSTGFGVPILLETHHSITATPYHRSGINFWNGYDPFVSEAAMQDLLKRQPVDFVLVCRAKQAEAMPFVEGLQQGSIPDWLSPMPGLPPQYLLLRVNRAKLP